MKINNKDLEMMAFSLPWSILPLLPVRPDEKDLVIRTIIQTWEEIKEKKK